MLAGGEAPLRRIARTLRPGGVLRLRDLIYDFPPDDTGPVVERRLADAPCIPATSYTRADLAEHVRTEHSTYRWLLEPMLQATALEIADVSFTGRVFGAYTCVKR